MNLHATIGSPPQQRLDSWKSIARHLDRSCRTVQRWHDEYRLPIHRLGGNKGSIFAYADELEDWMRNRSRHLVIEPLEIPSPVHLPTPPAGKESFGPNGTVNFSLISGTQKARSAELVALAHRMWKTESHRNLPAITGLLREAIELDPGNAAAFACLSTILIAEALWGLVSASEAYASAEEALQQALEIDAELPEVKCATAWLKLVSKRDWEGARRGFDELLCHHAPNAPALLGRAMFHIAAGNLSQASSFLLEVTRQSALRTFPVVLQSWTSYLAGEYAQAADQIDEVRARGQAGPIVVAVEALVSIQLEEPNAQIECIKALAANSPHHDKVLQGALGYAYARAGQSQRATEIFHALTRPQMNANKCGPYAIALVLIGLNQTQEAVKWLEESYREGSLWSLGFLSDPILAPLRNDPFFRQFLSKVSYPAPKNGDLCMRLVD